MSKSQKNNSPKAQKSPTPDDLQQRTGVSDVHHLLSSMLEYEKNAKQNGIDLSNGKFNLLMASEREFMQAELVADYIRLCAGNTGRTPVYYENALKSYVEKIFEFDIPSHEILGTYLAAMTIIIEDNLDEKINGFDEIARKCMVEVLRSCVNKLCEATEAAKAPSDRKACAA